MRSKKLIYIFLLSLFLTGCKGRTFTVTFDTLGGSLMESITINKGDNIEKIAPPTKEGYLFVSWLKDGIEYNSKNPINEDLNLTAHWVEAPPIYNYYTITFIVEGQTEKATVKENETVSPLEAPEIENYLFTGWYVGEEKFDFNTKITKDIALVAKYELNVVTIKYELDGGLGLSVETIPKNTTVPIPNTPTKEGYKFLKWTLNNKEFSFDTKITKDITLKAVWEPIEYVIVTFDSNGGNTIESRKLEKYSKINKLPIPTKEGYKFIGWRLDGEFFNTENNISTDITLIADYQPLEENIPEEELNEQ